jgi:hypothetical protein
MLVCVHFLSKVYLKSKVSIVTFVVWHVEQFSPNCKKEQIIKLTFESLVLYMK